MGREKQWAQITSNRYERTKEKSLLATQMFLKFPIFEVWKTLEFYNIPVFVQNTKCNAYFRKQLQTNLVTALELCVLVPYHYKAQTLLVRSPL